MDGRNKNRQDIARTRLPAEIDSSARNDVLILLVASISHLSEFSHAFSTDEYQIRSQTVGLPTCYSEGVQEKSVEAGFCL